MSSGLVGMAEMQSATTGVATTRRKDYPTTMSRMLWCPWWLSEAKQKSSPTLCNNKRLWRIFSTMNDQTRWMEILRSNCQRFVAAISWSRSETWIRQKMNPPSERDVFLFQPAVTDDISNITTPLCAVFRYVLASIPFSRQLLRIESGS